MVTTPTGSGKTLVYNFSFFRTLLKDTALYIFPTKALTQDQLLTIRQLTSSVPELDVSAKIYDGDTPSWERKKIKQNFPHIILTNPDMLQLAILPYHRSWRDFLSKLKFIVLDEVHTYKGVFGTHVAHIMRRLRRITENYGGRPQYILSSATIDSANRFAEQLIGQKFSWVKESGAPSGKKYFILWDSMLSPYTEGIQLLARCIRENLRTILFTRTRKGVELLLSWIKEGYPELSLKVAPYRAGYLPEERREIESSLFSGSLSGVLATSALELGIDVGTLDCCILLGYPGSITSTWQRVGRVGRGTKDALIFLIAFDDALDQYFLKHPEDFFSRGWERVFLNFENEPITLKHLICSAAESPICLSDKSYYGKTLPTFLEKLEGEGKLLRENGRWFAKEEMPQRRVNIRTTGKTYRIVDGRTGKLLGEVDEMRVFRECHPSAIYLHRGQPYEVLDLDTEEQKVIAQGKETDYYTQPSFWEKIQVLSVERQKLAGKFPVKLGKVKVSQKVTGYERRAKEDKAFINKHKLNLPAYSFKTISLWLEIPFSVSEQLRERGADVAGSLHATEHGIISIFPIKVFCDRQDIDGYNLYLHDKTKSPCIFIYDTYPGGVGLSARAFEIAGELFSSTLKLIKGCPCEDGCPSCIQSPRCGSGNQPLDKRGAVMLLEEIIQENKKKKNTSS